MEKQNQQPNKTTQNNVVVPQVDDKNLKHMNFEVTVSLHNAFKAKAASQGKKIKDVFTDFMKEYVENN